MSVPTSDIIGIVVLARDGDRQSLYQDTTLYTALYTSITPLGAQQEYQLGSLLRDTYLDFSSPSYIQAINPSNSWFRSDQVVARADGSDTGNVVFDSATALLQGLWPNSTSLQTIQLANGTNITSPLGGYQYVPIDSVDATEDVSLEGYTDCNTLSTRAAEIYQSAAFLAKAAENSAFLDQLSPYLDGRTTSIHDISNIYDYMNDNFVHNATFAETLPPSFLAQARDLANYHEYSVFTDPDSNGIGNVAAQTLLPSIIDAVQRIMDDSDPLRLHFTALSYEPFLSLFNITGVVANGQLPAAIVNYAAAVVLEVHKPSSTLEPTIRFKFKNGTDDDDFNIYNLTFGNYDGRTDGDLPASTFISAFLPPSINSTLEWCNVCENTVDRGCAGLIAAAASQQSQRISGSRDKISPVGAGFLGAGLAVVVMSGLLALLLVFGALSCGRRPVRRWSKKGMRHRGGEVELGSEFDVNSIHKMDSIGR